jgi:hypothetical protein
MVKNVENRTGETLSSSVFARFTDCDELPAVLGGVCTVVVSGGYEMVVAGGGKSSVQ